MQKIRSEKGITLTVLIVTIIVLLLISAPMVIYTVNLSDVSNLTRHREDFYNLSETVSQVYEQGTSLAGIGATYTGNTQNCNNPNDGNTYYVINATKLDSDLQKKYNTNMKHLNYGELNYSVSGNTSSLTGDIYIINEQSRTIYYLQGFTDSKGNTLYTYPDNYTEVQIQNYVE